METYLQKEFKSIALKYAKEFAQTELIIGTHYEFKFYQHSFTIYFYDNKTWCFNAQYNDNFRKKITFSDRGEYQEISFSLGIPEKAMIQFLLDIKNFYEDWLMTVEAKKSQKLDEELFYARERLNKLEKLITQKD